MPPDLLLRLLAARAQYRGGRFGVIDEVGAATILNTHRDPIRSEVASISNDVATGCSSRRSTTCIRLHMHPMRFADARDATAVCGAVLLVHGSVHRAGSTFPSAPIAT